MATLVLSTVGNALGGPIGGAVGALIGQSIDQELLAPARRGPRVGDLNVQTSSYGTQIPRVYGMMRVAGSVVWATDLVEQSQTGGAKGQPDVSYSYTVSMAVALSSRQATSIKRIWADGKLLRGAAGDLKVGGTLRFLDGSEDQAIDPLIGSIEGILNTPAYRGLALAVFEDLELAEYGNRIPFLTFEIEADVGPVAIGTLLADASGGLIDCASAQTVAGFAAYGASIKQAIEPLVDSFGLELFDDGTALRSPGASTITVSSDELGNNADAKPSPLYEREQVPARDVPATLRLTFYDPDRDYQGGEARAASGEQAGNEAQRDLPAVLTSADAKSLAHQMLARAWAERDTLRLRLPPDRLALEPGSRIDLPFSPSLWTVRKVTIDGFVVATELKPSVGAPIGVAADGGRIAPNSDVVAGAVNIALFDIPTLLPNSPTLLLAASSPSPGWKRVRVDLSFVGQSMAIRTAARKSMLGSAVTDLASTADPSVIDTGNSFEVQLIDGDQWLTSCDDAALAAGTNLALIGRELVQFGDVTPLGSGRFRLARLLRGRSGTEPAISSHAIDEVFCMIEAGSLQSISLPITSIGAEVTAEIPGGASVSLVVRPRADAIASPSGGTTVDAEARTSIDQVLATLRQHGLIET